MTQHILANETGIADVADPLGGSYYIESLTNEIETQALKLVDEISEKGGANKAIEEGFYQRLIRESASQYQQQIETGERVIVGLNRFREEGEKVKIECFKVEEGVQEKVIGRLHRLKSERDNDRVNRCLQELAREVRAGHNTVPALIECARAYATIGEMCRVLGSEWGLYQEGALWI
jgi:methylmalonyl-CoA mutase N-terminal domain/subunit